MLGGDSVILVYVNREERKKVIVIIENVIIKLIVHRNMFINIDNGMYNYNKNV